MAGWPNLFGKDIAFIAALTEVLEADLCVTQGLMCATGWSYGAGTVFSVGCSFADRFRAGVAIGVAIVSGRDRGQKPIAYMGFRGTDGRFMAIENGRNMRDRWAHVNGCQTPSAIPEPKPGDQTHFLTEYSGCLNYPV